VSAQQVETSRRDVSTQEVETLAVLSERLLASLRELLAGYELVVAQMRTEGAPPSRSSLGAQAPRAHAAHPQEFTLSAGPFHTTIALREFQRAITTLPGVREVAVREYEGADRAILHVQLDEGTA
jgi:hypothetical protein